MMLHEVRCPTCRKLLVKIATQRATVEAFCKVCGKLVQTELVVQRPSEAKYQRPSEADRTHEVKPTPK